MIRHKRKRVLRGFNAFAQTLPVEAKQLARASIEYRPEDHFESEYTEWDDNFNVTKEYTKQCCSGIIFLRVLELDGEPTLDWHQHIQPYYAVKKKSLIHKAISQMVLVAAARLSGSEKRVQLSKSESKKLDWF